MAVPTLFGNQANWGDSHTFVLPKSNTRSKEESVAALEFMKGISDQGSTWVKAGHIPANLDVLNSDIFKALPYRSDYAAVADTVVYFGNSPRNWSIKTVMIESIDLFLAGQSSADEAVDAMISGIKSLL